MDVQTILQCNVIIDYWCLSGDKGEMCSVCPVSLGPAGPAGKPGEPGEGGPPGKNHTDTRFFTVNIWAIDPVTDGGTDRCEPSETKVDYLTRT